MEGGNLVAYQSVEEMKNVDPRTVDRSQLVDRESVRLDPDAGYEERLKSHIRQIRQSLLLLRRRHCCEAGVPAERPYHRGARQQRISLRQLTSFSNVLPGW